MATLILLADSWNTWTWRTWEWISDHPFLATVLIGGLALVLGVVGGVLIGSSVGASFFWGAIIGGSAGGLIGVGICSGIANFGIGGPGGTEPGVSQSGQSAITRVEIKYTEDGTLQVTINRQGPDRRPVTQYWSADNLEKQVEELQHLMGKDQKSIPVRWIGVPQALRQTVVEAFYAAGISISDLEIQETPSTSHQTSP